MVAEDVEVLGPGIGAGIRKEDTELKDKINAAIKAVRANGKYDEITKKYFDFDIYGGEPMTGAGLGNETAMPRADALDRPAANRIWIGPARIVGGQSDRRSFLPASAASLFELLSPTPPGWGGNLLRGLVSSIEIALGAYSVGIAIGIAGAYGKLYGGPIVRDLLEVYTTIVRAIPELVLILLLYFAGTDLINRVLTAMGHAPVDISGLVAGIIVLGFVQGAYSTEVLRGAILAVPQGQIEAARAYGMSPGLLLRRITLAGDAALRHSRPLQSLADRHQGHRTARGRRLQRAGAGDAPGRRRDQGLLHLLRGGRRDLSHADAVFQRRSSRASSAGRGAACRRCRAITDGRDEFVLNTTTRQRVLGWLQPHRIVLIAIGLLIVACAIYFMRWDWLPNYADMALQGIWRTIWLLVVTSALGFALAVPLGFWQAAGPRWLGIPAKIFCTIIRGTPLLVQLWLLYYGLGSLFPQFPWIRKSCLWPYLRQAWPYAVLSLTLSYAGYEGEVMRGAFAGVPRGQLEAARAFGMSRWKVFRRIWLPQAVTRALPTLGGETVLQLKATPLVATITMIDIYSVASRVQRDTFIVYEPLLLLAVVYLVIAGILVLIFRKLESRVPSRLG